MNSLELVTKCLKGALVLYEFYQKKCTNKPKKVALGAVMRKLVNIIFAVMRDKKPFELRTPEEHEELLLARSLVA